MWKFAEIKASKEREYETVVGYLTKMPGARWFISAKLNFAENPLRWRDDHSALIFKGKDRGYVKMTYAQLYDNVARLVKSLKRIPLQILTQGAADLKSTEKTKRQGCFFDLA